MLLSTRAKLATLETIEKQASIASASEAKGGTSEPFHGKLKRYSVTIEELNFEDLYAYRDPSIGEWLDCIHRAVNYLMFEYDLDMYIRNFDNLSIGTWYDEANHMIECALNTTFDSLHLTMLTARHYKQRFIYDNEKDVPLNVEQYFMNGGLK